MSGAGGPSQGAQATSKAVLVVEDEPALLNVTGRILRAAGYGVTMCSDGRSAIEQLALHPFDVIVSDIHMPGMDGITLLRRLRELSLDVPLVLVTGAPSLDTAVQAVEYGAFKYVTKPVDPDELLAVVARALENPASGSGVQRAPRAVDSQSLPAVPVSLAAGVVLGDRYRLVALLGEGGMSQVWEATQLVTGRAVAVKLLRASLNARPGMRKRILREARAASSVRHPNVVDVFDVFELADGTPVLVMALLQGLPLTISLAVGGPLSFPAVADLLLPVVSAVGTAHTRGVVHRDLKPDNIFIAEESGASVVKVLDFGVAKLLDAEEEEQGSGVTATGVMVGTPGYMSPEQAFAEKDVDCRADVWAIGAIVYEALAGVRPVEGANVGQMIKSLMVDGVRPLRLRRPDLPGEATQLVDRMLTYERAERMGDLREAYAVLARHARVSAPPFGPPRRAASPNGSAAARRSALALARTEQSEPILGRRGGTT
jgi:serine/threonine-protein kinase